MDLEWDVIIIGGGPAGLAAAIYSGRALRKAIVLEKRVFGGQIIYADIIENYPGYAEPQIPYNLMDQFVTQAKRYGAVLENEEVFKVHYENKKWNVILSNVNLIGTTIIYSAGSENRLLNVPGEKELFGKGISICATCDAPFFSNRRVAVIGGGDTALVEALHLSKFASEVVIIHRRDSLRAEKILQDRAFANKKIHFFWNQEIVEYKGIQRLEEISIKNCQTQEKSSHRFDGVFVAIGTIPNTKLIEEFADLDEFGYVLTDWTMTTKSPGLFVAGEVIQGNHRQVAISSGSGVQAFLSCEKYLEFLN